MKLLEHLAEGDNLFKHYPEEEIRKLGFNGDGLVALKEDIHQRRTSDGFFGALVLNYFVRTNKVDAEMGEIDVSAYLFADEIGMGFSALHDVRDSGRELIHEKDGDSFISVRDLHLFVRNREKDSLTELASEYSLTKNPELRGKIAEKSEGMVRSIAKRIYNRLNGASYDDMVGDGYVGLLDAIEGFDPDRGFVFGTYAGTRIRGEILDGIRNLDSMPRLARQRLKALEKFSDEFREKNSYTPDKAELKKHWLKCDFMGASFDSFYYNIWKVKFDGSLDKSLADEDGRTISLASTTADKRIPGTVDIVCSNELKRMFLKDLQAIPKKYRGILSEYCIEARTMYEIGENHNISESRVSQLADLYLKSGSFFKNTRRYLGADKRKVIKLDL